MQLPPFTFWSISLRLAMTAVVLLISAQLISAYDGSATILADMKRLRYASMASGPLFHLTTVAIRIYETVAST